MESGDRVVFIRHCQPTHGTLRRMIEHDVWLVEVDGEPNRFTKVDGDRLAPLESILQPPF